MTSSLPPQPDQPNQAPVVSPVSQVSMSSPIAPLIIEKKRSSALSLLLGVALVVAVGGVAFAAGRLTAPPSASATGGRGGNGTGFGGGGTGGTGAPGAFGGAGFGAGAGAALTIQGTVQAITPTQLSIMLASGQTIQIPVDASTTYHGQAAASASDVKTGQQVQVQVAGGIGRVRGQGGQGGGTGGQGGGQASAPPAVGAPGTAPSAGTGTGGQSSGQGGNGGFGQGGALGPARDITIVTP